MARMLLLLTLAMLCPKLWAQEFVIITLNPDISQLRTNQLKMLYRGRLQHVAGNPVRLMDLPRGSSYREQFYSALLNKSPSQMNAIWARQSFSGKAVAPVEVESASELAVLDWLTSNVNGIAYVPAHLTPEDVYVIYHFE